MASLKDIATKCNVSIATVSKALNDQSDISKKTKEMIRNAAQELGYMPNAAARALKTKKSNSIGVLFHDDAMSGLTHEYFSGVLEGFKVYAEKQGYDITFINTSSENRAMSYYEHCRYRNFDGVAIVCVDFTNPEVKEVMEGNIPVVTIDYVQQYCSSISSNNSSGMEELVSFICEKGHRRIAYIHGQSDSYVTKQRMAGFFRALEKYDIVISDDYIREAQYLEIEDAQRETKNLLSLKTPPTCILYPDDTACIGGRNAVQELGLKIPDDISIAGYDGTRISQLLQPSLTTIEQDTREIGKKAAVNLIERIEHPRTAIIEHIVVNGKLCEGGSVAKL